MTVFHPRSLARLLAFVALPACIYCSCTPEEELKNTKEAIRFSAGIAPAVFQTRMASNGRPLREGSIVSLWMQENNNDYCSDYVFHAGKLNVSNNRTPLSWRNENVHYFAAYTNDTENKCLPPDTLIDLSAQVREDTNTDFDLLVAYASQASGEHPEVALQFHHIFPRLTLQFTAPVGNIVFPDFHPTVSYHIDLPDQKTSYRFPTPSPLYYSGTNNVFTFVLYARPLPAQQTFFSFVYNGQTETIEVPAGFNANEAYELTFDKHVTLQIEIGKTKACIKSIEINDFQNTENIIAHNTPQGLYTLEDLQTFRDSVNDGRRLSRWQGPDGVIRLYQDIDLAQASSSGWIPIGTSEHPFCCAFDGQNHTISHMQIHTKSSDNGFFGLLKDCDIRNLYLNSDTIILPAKSSNLTFHGILAGTAINSKINNCHSRNGLVDAITNPTVGGLIGAAEKSVILNCSAAGSVRGSIKVGGLIGRTKQCCITNSFSSGYASGTGAGLGGLIGEVNTTDSISNCYSSCHVSGTSTNTGILIGEIEETVVSDLTVNASYCYYMRDTGIYRIIGNVDTTGIPGFFAFLPSPEGFQRLTDSLNDSSKGIKENYLRWKIRAQDSIPTHDFGQE